MYEINSMKDYVNEKNEIIKNHVENLRRLEHSLECFKHKKYIDNIYYDGKTLGKFIKHHRLNFNNFCEDIGYNKIKVKDIITNGKRLYSLDFQIKRFVFYYSYELLEFAKILKQRGDVLEEIKNFI